MNLNLENIENINNNSNNDQNFIQNDGLMININNNIKKGFKTIDHIQKLDN